MIKSDLTYEVIELTEDRQEAFDIESWIADLLVDYWLSNKKEGGKKSDAV